jgi:small subunit ribosomal protein S1
MVDTPPDEIPDMDPDDFEKLLDAYSEGIGSDLQVGDQITGSVISIGPDAVFVDTGTKIDGVVDRSELVDADGRLALELGDPVTLYVIAAGEGEIRLAKALGGIGGAAVLQEAYANRLPVEGHVLQTCKGGFQVEMAKCRAFCPFSQMDIRRISDPESYVGQTYPFRITRYASGGRNIVVSRREILDEEHRENQAAFLADVAAGDVVAGTVSRIMPFGVFIELVPGLEGMAHISELSWSRVQDPARVVAVGDAVSAKVLEIKTDENGRPRIALSLKQAAGDPWERVGDLATAGRILDGTVSRCVKFGAFVEIAPGIEGLVHLSEMSYTRRVTHAEAVVSEGQSISVMVKEVDAANRRISLSLKAAQGDPWQSVEDQFKVGQRVVGEIVKKEAFGHFVQLAPGITGLLPKSNIKAAVDPSKLETLKPGSQVQLVVSAIDKPARRLTLAPVDLQENDDWQRYAGRVETPSAQSPMGDLGAKLQAALAQKKTNGG